MTAPDTNVEKQAKRHKPSLTGIAIALVFVGLLLVVGGMWIAQDPAAIEDDAQTIPAPAND